MSAVQTSLGRVTVKRCSNRFAATGKVCRESVVVTRKRRFCCTHRKPSSRRTRFGRAETRPEAVRREFLLQTLCAVSLAHSLVRGLCRDFQSLTRLCSLRWEPREPCVVAAQRNREHAAQHGERVVAV